MSAPPASPKRSLRSRAWKWTKRLLTLAVLGVVLAGAGGGGLFWYYSRDLPSVEELRRFRPAQVTKVTCAGGAVCAEFFTERRTWVDITTVPPHVKNAFLAAEDADFYKHQGLDYLGILRSAVKNLRPGGMKSGASTISQQACRGLLLSQERTLARKVREWILTPRMEAALTKDEILNLYVNTIYFGNGRYGVEEAALFYFGKSAKDLSLGEAAVIAGTVQSPYRKNPVTNVVKAKARQKYVLEQLWKHGFVAKEKTDAEVDKPIVLGPRPPPVLGGYYAEEVRKQLVARYGEPAVLKGGMRVEIAMDPRLQLAAESAVRTGLEAVDHRQGYRGPEGSIDLARFKVLKALIEKRLTEAGKRRHDEVLIADLEALKAPPIEEEAVAEEDPTDPEEAKASEDEVLVRSLAVRALSEPGDVVGVVTALDDAKGTAVVDLVGRQAQLAFKSLAWARRKSEAGLGPMPTHISEVVKPGELVRVRLGGTVPASQLAEATLAQVPLIQGALLAIEPKERRIVAMVGGYDFATSAFNRATQAERQPGSSFKPFLYATALATEKFTPITVINDAPEAIRDPWTGKAWKPRNYEKDAFEGPLTLREALTKSKNTVSVRLIEALGPEPVIDFAHKAGIKTASCTDTAPGRACLPSNLTLALGTGEVRMVEIANAYATLQSMGQYAEPITIIKVADASGRVLEEHRAAPEQVLPANVAFVITSLMRSVVEEGTAMAVLELQRPAVGKTGTASEFRDAWFSGYTTDYVASAWVGFDDHSPIGPGETGGRAALPVWLEFMKAAHQGLPARDFTPPEGVVQVRIDSSTGKLAGRAVPGRTETFIAGTQPTEDAPAPGSVDPNNFLLDDGRKGR